MLGAPVVGLVVRSLEVSSMAVGTLVSGADVRWITNDDKQRSCAAICKKLASRISREAQLTGVRGAVHNGLLLSALHLIDGEDLDVDELLTKAILLAATGLFEQPLQEPLLGMAVRGDLRGVGGDDGNLRAREVTVLDEPAAGLKRNRDEGVIVAGFAGRQDIGLTLDVDEDDPLVGAEYSARTFGCLS